MFKLRTLPSSEALGVPDSRYPGTDQSMVKSLLAFLRLGQDLASGLQAFLARYGLCQGTFFCLAILNRSPEASCCASALAKALGVSPPALTAVLTRLDALGYIERRIDPEDRRRLSVCLSPAGRAFLDELMPACTEAVSGFAGTVSEQDIGLLATLLDRLAQAPGEQDEARTSQ